MDIQIPQSSHGRREFRVPGTALLLMLLAVVYVLELVLAAVGHDARLYQLGALPDDALLGGEYWRLVTFGLLHSGLVHLLLNTLLLVVAGPIAERRTSGAWILCVFFAASIGSGVAIACKHALWPGEGISVGASGGMFGLIGAGLVLVAGRRDSRLALAALTVLLACGLAYSLLPHISMTGHVTGLLLGAGMMAMARRVNGSCGRS